MAPQGGVCQLSGHVQRVFVTYVLTLNDSSEQGNAYAPKVISYAHNWTFFPVIIVIDH